MLINLSNHPSGMWGRKQMNAAKRKYKGVVDVAFPNVGAGLSEKQVRELAGKYFRKIVRMIRKYEKEKNAVHIMGEMTFCFCLINMLLQNGITCVASTTDRIVKVDKDGFKTAKFNFVKFREYRL